MKIYKAVPFKLNNDFILANPYASGSCDFCFFYDIKRFCSKRFICNHFETKLKSNEIALFFIEK